MANVRIEIREDDGSSAVAEARAATPEQITARELVFDITNKMTLPAPETSTA